MVEKVIVIQNKETTEDGTLIITMQPVANARWTSNSGLIEAGVAVQPYGVFMIPDAETFVATGLMADVSINQVLFSTPLSALIAGDVEDEITFAAPYLNLTDLQDVTITSPSNGQALIWDATNSKWINGAGGGGSAGYTYNTSEIYNGTLQMTDLGEGNYSAALPASVIFVGGSLYDITINDIHLIAVAVDNEGSVYIGNDYLGVELGTEDGESYLSLYSPDAAVATAVTEITLISLTVTDGFKKAVGASTIILECDGTGDGSVLSPYGLTDVDAGNIDWLITQNVIIKDPNVSNGYWRPMFGSGTNSTFCGFIVDELRFGFNSK